MKKLLFLIVLFPLFVNAQSITKSEKIMTLMMGNMSVYEVKNYNNNELIDTSVRWISQNSKYQHITDLITVYQGSHSDFVKFVEETIKFLETNTSGTSMTIHGNHVSIQEMLGMKGCGIYPKDETGYCSVNAKILRKILKKYKGYMKKVYGV